MHHSVRLILLCLATCVMTGCGGGNVIGGSGNLPANENVAASAQTSAQDSVATIPAPAQSDESTEQLAPPQSAIASDEQSTAPVVPPRNYTAADITDLILVTGQSNALGHDTSYDEAQDSPHPRVFAFTNQGWQQADLHQVWDKNWYPRGEPGGQPSNNFAMHMAKQLANLSSDRVAGILLVTAPGESITHWAPGSEFSQHIDNKVIDAINQLPHKSQIDGILWHQGENDEGDTNYHHKLNALIANFREQSWFSSGRPFICGETAVYDVVNRQLMALNGDGDNWTGCVQSTSLHTHLDGYHFNAAGLRELGRRYAVKYLTMLNR